MNCVYFSLKCIWIIKWMIGWMITWMHEIANGQMDEWMNGWIHIHNGLTAHINICSCENSTFLPCVTSLKWKCVSCYLGVEISIPYHLSFYTWRPCHGYLSHEKVNWEHATHTFVNCSPSGSPTYFSPRCLWWENITFKVKPEMCPKMFSEHPLSVQPFPSTGDMEESEKDLALTLWAC